MRSSREFLFVSIEMKRYLSIGVGSVWLIWLVSLIMRRNDLSRVDSDPFLRYIFSFILLIVYMEYSMPTQRLRKRGVFLVGIYYFWLLCVLFISLLLIPWDYFDLWSLGMMIFFLLLYLFDRLIRGLLLTVFRKS